MHNDKREKFKSIICAYCCKISQCFICLHQNMNGKTKA